MSMDHELKVLLSEKDNADGRIGAYYELQVKILGIALSGILAVAGWLFANRRDIDGPERTIVLLVLVSVASIAILQATIFNGFALGFIHYKSRILGERIRELLSLDTNPLSAVTKIGDSPAGSVIGFSTTYLALSQAVLGILLFCGALMSAVSTGQFEDMGVVLTIAFLVSGFLLLGALLAMGRFVRALNRVRKLAE